MKLKSIITIGLATVLSLSIIGGCSKKDSSTDAASGQLTKVHEAVKNAFGESYVPSMPYDEVQLEETFGVKKDLVKEFIAEGPMMSVHVDTFVGIEANEGKVDEVEKALNAYREKLISDSMQYPMNLPKIEASSVQKVGNYVFFMILGEIPMEAETEEEQLAAAKTEMEKATKAVEDTLKK